ncbi:MAG: hypothetical protein OXF74_06295 [Rhodobacteraceae bacterium]|nr:hypothetical protein [Paracoccaceae bacterium]
MTEALARVGAGPRRQEVERRAPLACLFVHGLGTVRRGDRGTARWHRAVGAPPRLSRGVHRHRFRALAEEALRQMKGRGPSRR